MGKGKGDKQAGIWELPTQPTTRAPLRRASFHPFYSAEAFSSASRIHHTMNDNQRNGGGDWSQTKGGKEGVREEERKRLICIR